MKCRQKHFLMNVSMKKCIIQKSEKVGRWFILEKKHVFMTLLWNSANCIRLILVFSAVGSFWNISVSFSHSKVWFVRWSQSFLLQCPQSIQFPLSFSFTLFCVRALKVEAQVGRNKWSRRQSSPALPSFTPPAPVYAKAPVYSSLYSPAF